MEEPASNDQLYEQICMTCMNPTFCGRTLVNATRKPCVVKRSRNFTYDVLSGYPRVANNEGYSWVFYPSLGISDRCLTQPQRIR